MRTTIESKMVQFSDELQNNMSTTRTVSIRDSSLLPTSSVECKGLFDVSSCGLVTLYLLLFSLCNSFEWEKQQTTLLCSATLGVLWPTTPFCLLDCRPTTPFCLLDCRPAAELAWRLVLQIVLGSPWNIGLRTKAWWINQCTSRKISD